MSNYQNILTTKRKMPGQSYLAPAYELWNPWAWYKRLAYTPDRPQFGTCVVGSIAFPSPDIDGSRGDAHAPVGNNRTFRGVAPVKGVYGGLS
jgi:hypothetical protein